MAAIASNGTGGGNWSATATWTGAKVPCLPFAVTACNTFAGGIIQVTVTGNVTTGNGTTWANGDTVNIYGVLGTTEANGSWVIANLSGGTTSTFTLTGSTFTNTYTSGGYSYRGDTVTITTGDAVTLDSGACDANGQIIVGSDPTSSISTKGQPASGTAALTIGAIASTGTTSLTIPTGVTLRVRCSIVQNGYQSSPWGIASLVVSAGGILIFDPKSGSEGTWTCNYNGWIVCNGTSGSHCTVQTDLTRGGTATLGAISTGILGQSGVANGGLTTTAYTDFTNFGTTATNALGLFTYCNNNYSASSITISITNCTFTGCSYWWLAETLTTGIWDGLYTMSGCIFSSTPALGFASTHVGVGISTGTAGNSHLKQITNCSFDALVNFDTARYVTWTNCVFAGAILMASGIGAIFPDNSYFNNNVVVFNATQGTTTLYGSIRDCYLCSPVQQNYFVTGLSLTLTGCVFEQVGSTANNGHYCVNAFTNHALTAYKCFMLGVWGGTNTTLGRFVQHTTGNTLTVEHCLFFPNTVIGTGIDLAEGSAPVAGTVASCKANILYNIGTISASAYLIAENAGGGAFVLDAVTSSGYNGMLNPHAGSCKYNAGASTANANGYISLEVTDANSFASGLNAQVNKGDLAADPVFTDLTYRGIIGWANRTQGQAATWAATVAYLQANPSLVPTMINWVRAGYVPTNVAYKNATYPGDTMTTDANGNPMNGTVGPMGFPATGALFRQSGMSGIGSSGPFFGDPMTRM